MTATAYSPCAMAGGEVGLGLFLALAITVELAGAAKAEDAAFVFYARLAIAASVAALFALAKRHATRALEPPPQKCAGKPNYCDVPVKFATIAAMTWASRDAARQATAQTKP